MQKERELLFPTDTKFKLLHTRKNPNTGLDDYIIGLGMQKGGSIILDKQESQPNKEAMTAMMKSKIAYGDAFRNPTAMRMTNRDPRSYTFTSEDEMNGGEPAGSRGNVYVGSYGNRIVPGIQDVNGQLKYIAEPFDDKNIKRTMQQSMQFDSPEDAEYFGEHYKEVAPMMHVWGKQEMQMGGMSIPGVNGTVVASSSSLYNKYKSGGQHGGLDRWFAEKWVDVKSGKPCGRQEGENRAYPACRPSRRVSSKTPKTSSEMSSQEKAKFKASKTSSERIPYNHKRK